MSATRLPPFVGQGPWSFGRGDLNRTARKRPVKLAIRAPHEVEKIRATTHSALGAYAADCVAGNVNVMVVPAPTVLEA
jgi:hypothetical protein